MLLYIASTFPAMRLRLLTIIILGCLTLFIVKAVNIAGDNNSQSFSDTFLITPLSAKESEEEESAEEEDKEEGEESADAEEDPTAEDPTIENVPLFSETEVDILQRLSARRQKLEEWQHDLEMRENVLNITQTKIDQKLKELRFLKNDVEKILSLYNEKEDNKLRRLVKVYENMKPKNAAKIFSEMDSATLLKVASKMKEVKLAPILAQMDPELAKNLTTQYAVYRQLGGR